MTTKVTTRDPETDPLLTAKNAAMVLIDYQPEQFGGVGSIRHDELMLNVVALGRIAGAFSLPVVLSTVGVEMGVNAPTSPELRMAIPDVEEIDRTTLNSWEDPDFRAAVERTGRRKLIMGGLWTEVCVAFPTLDAIRDGYQVFVVADAIGGVTLDAHERAMQRMVQAGAVPITTLALACELQRDWGRRDADRLREIMRWYFPALRHLRGAR